MKNIIVLIVSIIALIFIILTFKIEIKKEKKILAGKKLNNYLYVYNLGNEEKEINSINLINDDIYYILQGKSNNKSALYIQNLYNTNITKAKELEWNCNLEKTNIYCQNQIRTNIYNLDLKKIYETKDNNQIEIIPYKDTFIKLEENNLYITQNNKNQIYRTLKEELKNYSLNNYFVIQNNTYILFKSMKDFYLYNINLNKYQKIEMSNVDIYQKGFYFSDDEKYIVYNLEDNIIKEYPNHLNENNLITNLSSDCKTIYAYNSIENKLYILNLEKETIKIVDLGLNTINKIIINNNEKYLGLLNNKDFYILNLEELKVDELTIEEYFKENKSEITNVTDGIKAKYNVNIKIKKDNIITFPDFFAEIINDNNKIMDSLSRIEKILTKYNKDLFDIFYNNGYQGLNIYLTGTLTPSDYTNQVSNPAAYSLVYNNEYMIVIDINQSNLEELVCHELMHNLEFQLKNQNISAFEKWSNFNPVNFYYNDSYTSETVFGYTLAEDNESDIYFIDTYSHTYSTEDRARIFEKICACDEFSIINNYDNLYAKGLYLKEEILKYYPTLKKTTLFNSLN